MTKKRSKICQLFGRQIKKLRQRQGLSQEALAYEAGIHRTYIGSIERGERNPSLNNIYRIAKVLKVSLPRLFAFNK